ncbi:hypothetical protein GCM10028796_17500 [Ramlibacter monticola]|uniref:Uncharacterized protein n=1 Tax=Ramlibacter monticola TaxID=1926872 RepID=A0A936YVY6_9BURK|nr:hypothetical protein [Ramlibacter monticola]MBL0390575.1 hypothetical protein [Ramlibacter monticola]
MIRAAARFFRLLPVQLELAHLKWARSELPVHHRDLPCVLARIAELEDRCAR